MKSLTILYDSDCGLCCQCRGWLAAQPQLLPLEFLPLQSLEVARRFGDLQRLRPEEQMLVIADTGELWQGDAAWVMCLHALRDYRSLAPKFAHPLLRPQIKWAYRMISSNRHRLSDLLRLPPKKWGGLNQDRTTEAGCATGGCHL
jgi:predicted DCC family thiol-disulfide oxidoreductase YuxK